MAATCSGAGCLECASEVAAEKVTPTVGREVLPVSRERKQIEKVRENKKQNDMAGSLVLVLVREREFGGISWVLKRGKDILRSRVDVKHKRKGTLGCVVRTRSS